MFELGWGTQFSVFLCFERIRKQLSTLNNSSFQRRVEALNLIFVLILKHYYVSIRSRQMKCTLL